jgi:hypothetical protein
MEGKSEPRAVLVLAGSYVLPETRIGMGDDPRLVRALTALDLGCPAAPERAADLGPGLRRPSADSASSAETRATVWGGALVLGGCAASRPTRQNAVEGARSDAVELADAAAVARLSAVRADHPWRGIVGPTSVTFRPVSSWR